VMQGQVRLQGSPGLGGSSDLCRVRPGSALDAVARTEQATGTIHGLRFAMTRLSRQSH
jgi:hypothetical protein